jgi:hypothetical protein
VKQDSAAISTFRIALHALVGLDSTEPVEQLSEHNREPVGATRNKWMQWMSRHSVRAALTASTSRKVASDS